MATMICDIVTPEKMLLSTEASFVAVPASEGEIGFLPGRSPVMSTLRSGEIRVKTEGRDETLRFAVTGGYVENDGHKVVVLATRAANIADIDPATVTERLAETERTLSALGDADPEQAFHSSELAWYTLLDRLVTH
jgi:F-type H+-transporting ATPase subunit epsilon